MNSKHILKAPGIKTTIRRVCSLLIVALWLVSFGARRAEAGGVQVTHTILYNNDGYDPYSSMISGSDGNLYGTMLEGGPNGRGTVYSITTSGSLTVLYSFMSTGSSGSYPRGGVVQDPADGYLYGATESGGANSDGALYRITTSGSLTTLAAFTGTNGKLCYSMLVTSTLGGLSYSNLYGTTYEGGTNGLPTGYGTAFQLTTGGSLTSLHSFASSEGEYAFGGLTAGTDGNLYGTLYESGSYSYGSLFRLTTSGTVTVLHAFDFSDGAYPRASMITGTDGNLYGTTYYGGDYAYGTVFQLTTSGSFTYLCYLNDGQNPYGSLVQTPDGAFYGVTFQGGAYDAGTIFKVTVSGTAAVLQTVYSFSGGADGGNPYGGMVTGTDGMLYGSTTEYGTNGYGTIFRFIPGAPTYTEQPVAPIAAQQAQLNATVNPNGVSTQVYFQYGTDNTYSLGVTGTQTLGSGTSNIVLSATLTNLTQSTVYHDRLVVVTSTYGNFYGPDQSFETLPEPAIIQNPASNIGATSVLLSGTVNPNGYDTQVYFLYGTGTSYGSQTSSIDLGDASDNVSVQFQQGGLTANTLYYFVLATTGTAGTFYASGSSFTTGTFEPTIVENPAQVVNSFTVNLSGTVNPNGEDTSAYFQYGLTSSYGHTTSSQFLGNSTDPATLLAQLTGLLSGTTYHFCLTATDAQGSTSGTDVTFFTPAVIPGFTENGAQNVTFSGVTLSGSVNPGGLDTLVYFLYGTGTSYGSQTTPVDLGNGTETLNISAPLAGLLSGTTYHFRMVLSNSNGITTGSDQTFNTPAPVQTMLLEVLNEEPADGVPGTAFASFGSPIINANAYVAFAATLESGATTVTTANNSGIWADDSGGVRRLIARTSGTAPGTGGAVFSSLGTPVYNDNEEVAFLGVLKTGTQHAVTTSNENGIWSNMNFGSSIITSGSLVLVKRQGEAADGCPGTKYSTFNALVLSDDSLVYSATLLSATSSTPVSSSNNLGIWSVSAIDGQTRLIARTGSPANNPIKTLTIFPVPSVISTVVSGQSRTVDAVAGSIVYGAVFKSGSSAILKAAVQ